MIVATLYIAFFAATAMFMWWRFLVSTRDEVAMVGEIPAVGPTDHILAVDLDDGARGTSYVRDCAAFGYGLLAGFIG